MSSGNNDSDGRPKSVGMLCVGENLRETGRKYFLKIRGLHLTGGEEQFFLKNLKNIRTFWENSFFLENSRNDIDLYVSFIA